MKLLLAGHNARAAFLAAEAHRWRDASLATRLVVLFVVGSALIMLGAGYALYGAVLAEDEASEAAALDRKAHAAEQLLRSLPALAAVENSLPRIRDLALGYPQLSVGVIADGRWLLKPRDDTLASALLRAEGASAAPDVMVESDAHRWRVHRVRRAGDNGSVDVVLALEQSAYGENAPEAAALAVLIALAGTTGAALLALFVVRRVLRPLRELAVRAGAAAAKPQGERIGLAHLPPEIRTLADSMDAMLGRLEEGFGSLEQFSADVAHELRTPLNNMLVETQVTLSRPRAPEEYREALEANLEEIERLQHMVCGMLFLARAERGMLPLAIEDVDLGGEAAAIVEYFEPAACDRSQSIAVAGGAVVRADRSLVRRAISAVVSDALRACPSGSAIAVDISTEADGVLVRVAHPGTVSQADLDRLLGPGRRDECRIGTGGLGIAIALAVMKLLGGRAEASSRAGIVTFALRFPLRADGHGGG